VDISQVCRHVIFTLRFESNPLGKVNAYRYVDQWWGCHLSASGQACSAAFPLPLMEQLQRCDWASRASFVRAGCTTDRWGEVSDNTSLPHAELQTKDRTRLGRPLKSLLMRPKQVYQGLTRDGWWWWWWWWVKISICHVRFRIKSVKIYWWTKLPSQNNLISTNV